MKLIGRVVLGRTPETLVLPLLFLVFVPVANAVLGNRMSASWAMASNVAAAVGAFTLGAFFLHRALPEPFRRAPAGYDSATWIRSGFPLFVVTGLVAVNTQIGIFVVGVLKTSGDVGVFNVAVRVASFISFLILAASYPLMPRVSHLHAIGDHAGLQRLLTTRLPDDPARIIIDVRGNRRVRQPILDLFGHGYADGVGAMRILAVGELAKAAGGYAASPASRHARKGSQR